MRGEFNELLRGTGYLNGIARFDGCMLRVEELLELLGRGIRHALLLRYSGEAETEREYDE